ncbi:CDP-diacylglycerol--serine O-phosphatidyltransferase [Halalkalibacterium halodurans]|jgi:CDP-diacylglycerol--serine O-phosphatidyltransferase|uniref:CDP-diacylglycerol--serine O-phosphatidyltransferase n=2 Tax=Halalkalibacterium halodurans TaxID=86665 RepID=Q9KDA4_HALH5|nr:CDP-diacylglycerol--serine O-phosphatidyltransferase [Halalkalibacterium halodurans]MDY7221837.1 CDP-diacylglycerol--serine O-phosphatidyltransferase [Halalkalibacterium halodurans]MDY7241113.1 CDP-diacylglycerol--serine O-phosphatidyltransferase [Halalkalibacterium halodurans]MED4080545.1 CDP-diacylglycerol--serine O-phosphatidyltransferase [Halalkalibacterium halodurans]MED4083833.1 CDP-diacylglycerol--serine O-phosphatidyltransferase [Halalkalibacterium halodurans]MED4105470.1 CDP-diacyl
MFLLQQLDHTVKKMKSQLANFFTIINLSCGVFAILFTLQGELRVSLLFITIAAVFDRLDGAAARKFDCASDFGKQLDSLTDIISFGVAPALMIYHAILFDFGYAGALFTVFYIACGAIRLARFNITENHNSFIGLPITAAGCILTLLYLAVGYWPDYTFMFAILILSFLMVSTIRVRKM